MKSITIYTTFLTIALLSLGSAASADSPATKATVITGLASMPLAFTENQGQWDSQVLFRANAGGATMWFTKDGAYYQFTRRIPGHSRELGNPVGVGQYPRGPDISDHDVGTTGVPTYRGADVTQPGEPVSGVEGSPDQPARGRQMSTSAPLSVDAAHEDIRRAHNPPSNTQDEITVSYVGSALWGGTRGVEIVGNYAYCAMLYGLMILDVSAPGSPHFVSQVYMPKGTGEDVVVAGNYAFVADGVAGLQIVDVTDPESPLLCGGYDTPGYSNGVAVDGNYVYVADSTAGLHVMVMDTSIPCMPIVCTTYATPGSAFDVEIAGNYAYIADGVAGGLQVIDISTPCSPIPCGSSDTPGSALRVTVAGNYAYIVDGDLHVIDVTDPCSPVPCTTYYTPGQVTDVEVVGSYAYVTNGGPFGGKGLLIFDISDPCESLPLTGSYPMQYDAQAVAVMGDYAYVAESSGLHVVNITNPFSPDSVGSYDVGYVSGMAVVGDSMYVASDAGLHILDITNPSNPVVETTYAMPHSAWDVAAAGNYAYIVDYVRLLIVDISTLDSVGGFDPGHPSVRLVAVDGDYAYLGADDAGGCKVHVVDISDVSNPIGCGLASNMTGIPRAILVAGSYVYLTAGRGGFPRESYLHVVDATEPCSASVCATNPTIGDAYDVAVAGDSVYVADSWAGLRIVDHSTLCDPVPVGAYPTPDYAYGVAVAGNYAFVTLGWTGLQVVNIADSSSPFLAGSYDTPGSAREVEVDGNYIYVSDSYGLLILSYSAFCCNHDGIRGDVDLSSSVNVADLSYLVSYLFDQPPGPAPPCFEEADVDASLSINVGDLAYLVSYLFDQPPGPAPLPCP